MHFKRIELYVANTLDYICNLITSFVRKFQHEQIS